MTKAIEQLTGHLRVLVEEIGERPGGTPANHTTIAYLTGTLQAAGWVVEEQWFACPNWTDRGTLLEMNGRALPAATNAFSPPVDVHAPYAAAGTLEELREAELGGKIAVLYGDLVPAPLSPKAWFLLSEREAEIIALLEEKQPLGILTVQRIGGGVERLIEDADFHIASATISAETGRELLQNPQAALRLVIASTREEGRTANVVARAGRGAARVVICAHHDTKFGTPGALDNAGGAAVVLALAQTIDPTDHPFALELVFFANEEYLPIGDDEYLRRQGGDDLSEVALCINIDGAGLWTAPDSITAIGAGPEFEAALHALTEAYPAIVWTDPWPESNHSTFSWRGVPSVAFTSATRTALAHQPTDNLEWISTARLVQLRPLIEDILELVGSAKRLRE